MFWFLNFLIAAKFSLMMIVTSHDFDEIISLQFNFVFVLMQGLVGLNKLDDAALDLIQVH